MKEKDTIKKELEELAPFLSKLEKKENYTIPTNYFTNLADTVLEQVQEPPKAVANAPSWFDAFIAMIQAVLQPRYAVGFASIVLFVLAGLFWFSAPTTTILADYNTLLEESSSEEISTYIAAHIDDFDESILSSLAEDMDLDFLESIEDKELENYIDELIETESLEELDAFL